MWLLFIGLFNLFEMLDFLIDLLIDIVLFKIGSVSIFIITLGRYRVSMNNCSYPYAVSFLGLIVLIILIIFGYFLFNQGS